MNDTMLEKKLARKEQSHCPVEMQVVPFLDKQLTPSDQIMMEMHIAQCSHCKKSVAKLEAKIRPSIKTKKMPPLALMGNALALPYHSSLTRARAYQLFTICCILLLFVYSTHSPSTPKPSPNVVATVPKFVIEWANCSVLAIGADYPLSEYVMHKVFCN